MKHSIRRRLSTTIITSAAWLGLAVFVYPADPPPDSPEARAARFLAGEVSRWSRQNACFSCHHNGDSARALIRAERAGIRVPRGTLDPTYTWVSHPERWDGNGGDGPFNDKVLARIVFSSTLKDAAGSSRTESEGRSAVIAAAERVAADQAADGSWKIEGDEGLGSPASYGRRLATLIARESLHSAEPKRFHASIVKADEWLTGSVPKGVFDAAVTLWATANSNADAERITALRTTTLDLIRRGQSDDGGWGPFVTSPPEIFDTAIVLLALKAAKPPGSDVRRMIENGRAYLIANQRSDGSWTETTRPAGSESEAQHLSTTGWALLALLETQGEP